MGDDERDESRERGFTVVDRRGRDEETSGSQDETAKPGATEDAPGGGAASPGPGGSAPPGEGSGGRGFTLVDEAGAGEGPAPSDGAQAGGEPPLPPVDFSGLALSLATSALYHLGLVADPESGEPGRVDLRLARHTIDTLELLKTKTQGNLTEEESTLLTNLLTELRMRFVEARDAG